MSFISVVVCDDFISVMADSRGSQVYTDGRFAKVLSETEEKITQITKYTFYSITGILEDAKDFMIKSNFIENNIINDRLKDKKDIEEWINKNVNSNTSVISYRIIFGGLSVDNKFKVYTIESGSNCLEELVYSSDSLSYSLSPSIFWDNNNFPDITFRTLLQTYDGTIDSIKIIQKNINDIIAGFDQSVNTNTKNFSLERKDLELLK